jgi:hypothetical protein
VGDTHHKIVIRDGGLLQKNGYRFFRCRRDITILTSRNETNNHSRFSIRASPSRGRIASNVAKLPSFLGAGDEIYQRQSFGFATARMC